jgi:predicted Zn-dependent protease
MFGVRHHRDRGLLAPKSTTSTPEAGVAKPKESIMDRNNLTTKQQRQLKFAEAGILFVLVMALTVFVGVRMASHSSDDTAEPVAESVFHEADVAAASDDANGDEPTGSAAVADEADAAAETASVDAEPAAAVLVSYAEAEEAYFAGRWAEAADLFDSYTRRHPDNAWGHYMFGLSQAKDGVPEGAIESFLTALDIAPSHIKSRINLARAYLDLDQPEAALGQLQQAVASEPDNVPALRVLGRTYDRLGQTAAAITAYRDALRVDPQDSWSLNNLGLVYIEAERAAEAVAPLARACQLDSSVACFQNNLGIALERTGHPGAAAAAFAAALQAEPDYTKAAVSLDRLKETGGTDQPIGIDLEMLAAEFSIEPSAAEIAANEDIARLDPQLVEEPTSDSDQR